MRQKVFLYLSKVKNYNGRRLLVVKGATYITLRDGVIRRGYLILGQNLTIPISHKEVR